MEKLQEMFIPSVLSSGVAIGLYNLWLGESLSDNINFAGVSMPAWATVGASAFVGSVAGEFLSDVVIPKIPKIGELGNLQEMILPPAVIGLTTYGSMMILVDENASFQNSFLLGAGSSVLSKYVYKML